MNRDRSEVAGPQLVREDGSMRLLRIDDILADTPIDPESHLDPARVESYAQRLAALPPGVVFDTPEGLLLADGYHRVAAARHRRRETVEAKVRRGSRRAALEYAVAVSAAERGISGEEATSYIRHRSQGLWSSED